MALYNQSNSAANVDLTFDALGTDKLNWFSVDKLLTSPWSDVKTEGHNFFSIQGDCSGSSTCRSFLINRNYGECVNDMKGWLMASNGSCSWESTNTIYYSKLSTYAIWSNTGKLS